MKRQIDSLDAVPSKRLFLSIIADYDLNRSICELVDNAFDVWTRRGRSTPLKIDVVLDEDQATISVADNGGGLPRTELRYIVGPGQSGSSDTDDTIGIFGVGTKRAVVALAEDVTIRTRHLSSETFQVEFDDAWLEDDDWALPLFKVDDISPGTTQVELHKLRIKITSEIIDKLRDHLGATYANFLLQSGVELLLNGKEVRPRFFDNWSFPPGYEPRRYRGAIESPTGSLINVEVLAGLSNESSPASGEYGVYFYCNDRLVAPAMKSFDVGFTKGQAGLPHPKVSLTKVIVSLNGDASQMPWNSSKSDISTKHHVFIALHDWLVTVVSGYAKVSRAWQGQWPDQVFKHTSGEIVDVEIEDFIAARKSFLPVPPKTKLRFAERVAERNKQLVKSKPWVRGLYEGVVAAETVAKQPLRQGNWLAFNLLDITLTSAFKAYLINETDTLYSDKTLRQILRRAPRISPQLQAATPLTEAAWTEIEYMSRRHYDLTYGRADPTIDDNELNEATTTVKNVLSKLFEISVDA